MTATRVMPVGEKEVLKQKLGVAVLGLGEYSGEHIIPGLQHADYCELRALITGDEADKGALAAQFSLPEEKVFNYGQLDAVARSGDVQLVYIAVPNALHYRYVTEAAKHGLHVLCEKPLAPTVKECEEMLDACSQNKVRLFVSYRLQFNVFHQEITRLARNAIYGKVKRIQMHNGFRLEEEEASWRLDKKVAGGGSLLDMGIYLVQAARNLTGEMPEKITARKETDRPQLFTEVEDTVIWQMEYAAGIVAECSCSYSQPGSFLKVEAENGSYELSNAFAYKGINGSVNGQPLQFPNTVPEPLLLDHAAYSILYNTPSPVDGAEGLKDIAVIARIYDNLR